MVSISRKKLYEKLWSIGTSKTAKELNVPYNKLKDSCISNDIPLPTASYWSRLHMGKEKPTQPLLPNPGENLEIILDEVKVKSIPAERVVLSPLKSKTIVSNEPASITNEIAEQQVYFSYLKAEQSLLNQIFNSLKVNKTLSTNPHKEIVKYRQKNNTGTSYYRVEKLRIDCSSGVIIPETLPFIDSLFKGLEKAGAKINITHNETKVLYNRYVFL